MKTLARDRDKAEILGRLGRLRPESLGRWGRMSAHQMVCHLSDAYRMATGEKRVTHRPHFLETTIVKWIALYLPLSWPAGFATRPEIDQEMDGTKPLEFAADVAELVALIELVAQTTGNWPRHPIFGTMSRRAWLRWAYLHANHHLRQFGV